MTSMRADAVRNRDLVLATARQAMAEGDLSLQLNDIARRAGIGVGTVYRHFPTRRALLESLAEPAFAALLDDAQVASRHPDAWTGLQHILRTLLVQQLSDPAFTEVMSTSPALDASPDTTSRREHFADLAQAVLERARQAGALRPDLTPDDLHHLVCGIAFALRLTPDPNACLDRYLQVLFDGIKGSGRQPAT